MPMAKEVTYVTSEKCAENRKDCAGSKAWPTSLLVSVFIALAGLSASAIGITNAASRDLEATKARVSIWEDQQREMRQDVKTVLRAVTQIQAKLEQQDKENRP